MRKLSLTAVALATLLAGASIGTTSASACEDGDGRNWAMCQFKDGAAYGNGGTGEVNLAEAQQGADGLCTIAQLASYAIPYASWGCLPSSIMALGDIGKTAQPQTIVQTKVVQGKTKVVHYCYDKDAPGNLVPMDQCIEAVESSRTSSATQTKPAPQVVTTVPPAPVQRQVALATDATKQ